MGQLRTKMEQDLVIRGLGEQTGKAYLRAVEGLTRQPRTPSGSTR